MTILEQLEEKIKKAVPSVYSPGMWIAGELIKGEWRPITLEDVLMALNKIHYPEKTLSAGGGTIDYHTFVKSKKILAMDIWKLNVPLSEQSEEVLNKLNDIL